MIDSVAHVLDPKTAASGATLIDFIDPAKIEKKSDHTVVFTLKRPVGIVPETFANPRLLMRGLDDKGRPVGTGPFVIDSFVPGQQALLHRFDAYWGEKPGFTNLRIVSFQEQEAITNALLGRQIDVAYSVPFTDVPRDQREPPTCRCSRARTPRSPTT